MDNFLKDHAKRARAQLQDAQNQADYLRPQTILERVNDKLASARQEVARLEELQLLLTKNPDAERLLSLILGGF